MCNYRLAAAYLVAMSALGCRLGSGSMATPEIVSIQNPRQDLMWKKLAIERGYPWAVMTDSITAFARRDWETGDIDSIRTEWAFHAKKSPLANGRLG